MTQKFGRNYRLTIYPLSGAPAIIITMPFTISFSIVRDTGSYVNQMEIDVYNLSEEHRNQIYQDRYVLGAPTDSNGQPILNAQGDAVGSHNLILEAGYSNLYRVFYGRMFEASSARQGTNIITCIKGFDSNVDVASTQTFQTLQSGQTLGDVLKFLIAQFPGLQLGAIGDFPEMRNRPTVLNGNTWDLLKQYSNANVYIDNGKVYVLHDNEVLDTISVIDDSTGLLETPRRDQGALYVTTLFEPSVQVGQQIKFQSSIQKNFNGTYKVIGIAHRGMISGAVCGRLYTVFRLLAPNQFGSFKTVAAA